MRPAASAPLSAGFWRTAALTMAWAALPLGVLALFRGVALWGALFTGTGVAAVVLAVSRSAIRWAESRSSSLPLARLFLVAMVLDAFVEIWFAARPLPLYVAPKAAALAHGLILLALTAVTAWQLMRSQPAK
jgi:hypothetical protein